MKKLLSLCLTVCMLLSLFVPFAVSAADPVQTGLVIKADQVTVDASATTATVGIWLNNLTDEDDLGTIDLKVSYDQSKLQQTDVYAETGSGRNKVYYGAACFEGGYQFSEPGGTANPLTFIAWTTAKENPCYDSAYEMNTYEFAFIDFEILGDWQGRTALELSVATLINRPDDADMVGYTLVDGWIQRGEYVEPILDSVEVSTAPTKTEYVYHPLKNQTENLKLGGGKVTLHYTNAADEIIDLSSKRVSVTGFDNTKVGTQNLTVTVGDKSTTFAVTVSLKNMWGADIVTLPTQTTCLEGQTPSLEGGVLRLYFGTSPDKTDYVDIDMTDSRVKLEGYDKTVVGAQTVRAKYTDALYTEGRYGTYTVTVRAKSLTGISLSTLPKTSYQMDEALDVTGGKLTLTYDNGDTPTMDLAASMVTGFDSSTAGDKTLTVTYSYLEGGSFKSKTTTYTVNVIQKQLTGISVETLPQTTYKVGTGVLDLTGGVLKLAFDNGSFEYLPMTDAGVTASGFDNSAVSNAVTVTLEYAGKETSFGVTILDKEVSSVTIVTPPAKLSYPENKLGDKLDLTNGIVHVEYDNGTFDDLSMTDPLVSVTGFNNTILGEQTITVNVGGKTCTFAITITEKTVASISVTKNPVKMDYVENLAGDEIVPNGGRLTVVYDNDTSDVIDLTTAGIRFTDFDNSTVGPCDVTVTYEGKTTTLTVNILKKSVTAIALTSEPDKKTYELNEALSVQGGQITVTYDNNRTDTVDLTTSMVTGFDSTTAGDKKLTIAYEGKTTTYTVTVKKPTVVESIAMDTLPDKLVYIENVAGEELNLSGAKVRVTYVGGYSEVVDLKKDDFGISGFDNTVIGKQTITITKPVKKSTTFEIEVKAKSVSNLKLTKPAKLSYLEGKDALNVSGGMLAVTYDNGTKDDVAITTDMISGFDNTKVGNQTLTVTYGGKSVTYDVTIVAKKLLRIEVTTQPTKLVFENGEALDTTGGVLTCYYDNDTTTTVALKENMVTGYDEFTAGEQTLTVTYRDEYTTTYKVTVKAPVKNLVSISVTAPTKVSYLKGEALNLNGGNLTLHYDDNSTGTINLESSMVSGYDANVLGEQTVTVTWEGKTATFAVTVKEENTPVPTVSSIALSTAPTKVEYNKGEALSVDGAQITVTMSDNSTNTVALTLAMISGYDANTVGTQTVTVTYGGKTTTFTVTVKEEQIPDPGILWGDANGDGAVNMKDVVLLRQYLANFDFSTGTSTVEVKAGADANGDGAINMKDVVLLRQYLANFDFSTGTSTIVLGPKA